MLPDDYLRKLKQDLSEVEAQVESKTRRLPVLDDRPAYDFWMRGGCEGHFPNL